jgi:hypothetical protein
MSWGLSDQAKSTDAYPNMLACNRCGTPVGAYISPAVYQKIYDMLDKIAKKLGIPV